MIQIESENKNRYLNFSLVLILALVVFVTIIIRIRHLPMPLERDEGEYAYAGQLILQGIPPYSLAYNMKMPGIYAAYALILAVFGQDQLGIHFGVLIINTATIILIYLLTKKLFGLIPAVAAGCFFAIISLSSAMRATANAENFVVLPAIAAILLLLKFMQSKKYLLLISAALLLGIAFMMKQHGAGFILFGLFYLFFGLIREKSIPRKKIILTISIYSFFVVLPFLITCLILWRCGVFEKFWYWTFDYARYYVGLSTLKNGIDSLNETLTNIIPPAALIWLFALAGFISISFGKQFRQYRAFIIGFTAFSFLALCPGLYFRPHYFILFLPALSILAGIGVMALLNIFKLAAKKQYISIILILIALSQSLYSQRQFLLETNPEILSRLSFGYFPFPECLQIAKYIKANSLPQDKIAVFGSEPEIYFYSQRYSATSFIYTYPLMENHPLAIEMQKEMISQVQANNPKFMVIVKTVDSWMPTSSSSKLIFEWVDKFIAAHYQQVGLVEIFKDKPVEYYWTADAKPQKSEGWIMILKRIN
jgi:hypothetical protein